LDSALAFATRYQLEIVATIIPLVGHGVTLLNPQHDLQRPQITTTETGTALRSYPLSWDGNTHIQTPVTIGNLSEDVRALPKVGLSCWNQASMLGVSAANRYSARAMVDVRY
jgi:hypothetical protein